MVTCVKRRIVLIVVCFPHCSYRSGTRGEGTSPVNLTTNSFIYKRSKLPTSYYYLTLLLLPITVTQHVIDNACHDDTCHPSVNITWAGRIRRPNNHEYHPGQSPTPLFGYAAQCTYPHNKRQPWTPGFHNSTILKVRISILAPYTTK